MPATRNGTTISSSTAWVGWIASGTAHNVARVISAAPGRSSRTVTSWATNSTTHQAARTSNTRPGRAGAGDGVSASWTPARTASSRRLPNAAGPGSSGRGLRPSSHGHSDRAATALTTALSTGPRRNARIPTASASTSSAPNRMGPRQTVVSNTRS